MMATSNPLIPRPSDPNNFPSNPLQPSDNPRKNTLISRSDLASSSALASRAIEPSSPLSEDRVSISVGAQSLAVEKGAEKIRQNAEHERRGSYQQPDAEQQALIQSLAARDAEVRAHEQAHKAVGGQYAGAISYSFETGPDGKRYAVGGEVPIDTAVIAGDPQATIQKLETVRAAALAPAEPSSLDRQVAALASREILNARLALRELAESPSESGGESGVESGVESGAGVEQAVSGSSQQASKATESALVESVALREGSDVATLYQDVEQGSNSTHGGPKSSLDIHV